MKASIEWLKEYCDIEVSNKELADILTLTGSKVETVEEKGEDIKNVVEELYSDDIVEVIEQMPTNIVRKIWM